jgi:ABC-2 type transport system permease protein
VILYVNPLTYGVNAIRGALLGYGAAEIPLDLALLGVFTVIMLSVAILITRREV